MTSTVVVVNDNPNIIPSATPRPNAIPIADGRGLVNGWITAQSSVPAPGNLVVADGNGTVLAWGNNFTATRDPVATDDVIQNYIVGACWINVASTPPTVWDCVSASAGAAVWQLTSPNSQIVTGNGTITTSSASDILTTGMTITPAAGTYDVWFSGAAWIGTTGAGFFIAASIYAGGSQDTGSVRQIADAVNFQTPFCCVAKVTVNGAQAIEGRWSVTAGSGTGTMLAGRSMLIRRSA